MKADITACIIAAAVFITLGLLLCSGRCLTLVTGYFAATPPQRERFDKRALGRFTGGLMFFFAACIMLVMAGIVFDLAWMDWAVIVLASVGGVGAFVYANTGGRFRRR